jgi:hypothetical protein
MANSDRPVFAPEVEFQIEQIQNQADLIAWQQLQALQVPTPIAQKMMRAAYPPQESGPPPRKKPNEIRMHIRSYARMLYVAEANLYQDGPDIKEQLMNLAARIIERIEATIADVEELGIKRSVSLAHHGLSSEQMRKAALGAVSEWIEKRLTHAPTPDRPPLPPHVQAQMTAGPQADAKQASAYAASGVDIASGSPLMIMAATAGRRAHLQPSNVQSGKRIGRSIHSEKAAQRMEAYIQDKGITQTQFSVAVNADTKTLYRFRRTGKVEKSVAKRIAEAMGITLEQFTA